MVIGVITDRHGDGWKVDLGTFMEFPACLTFRMPHVRFSLHVCFRRRDEEKQKKIACIFLLASMICLYKD